MSGFLDNNMKDAVRSNVVTDNLESQLVHLSLVTKYSTAIQLHGEQKFDTLAFDKLPKGSL